MIQRKGRKRQLAGCEVDEDVPLVLLAKRVQPIKIGDGAKRRPQARENDIPLLPTKMAKRVLGKRDPQDGETREERARKRKAVDMSKQGQKPKARVVLKKEAGCVNPEKQKGKTDAACLLAPASAGCDAQGLGTAQCQQFQLPANSSFASSGAGGLEKMEVDGATSPVKRALRGAGGICPDVLRSASECGLECSAEDCKEQPVLLPAATSADLSDAPLGPSGHLSSFLRDSFELSSCPLQQDSLRGAELPNPNLGLGAGLGVGVGVPSAERITTPDPGSVGDRSPSPSSPSLAPFVDAPHMAPITETPRRKSAASKPPLESNAVGGKLPEAPGVAPPSNAVSRRHMPEGAAFPLEKFQAEELVWARTGTRYDPFWPAKVVEMADVPEAVRRSFVPDALCVEYFGPSSSKKWDKDYSWVKRGNIFPFLDFATWFCGQDLKKRAKDFRAAVTAAMLSTSRLDGHLDPVPPELRSSSSSTTEPNSAQLTALAIGATSAETSAAGGSKECISCGGLVKRKGKRKEGLDEGHAVDLEKVCEACYKLFENKQYCWVCKQIWLPNQTDGWVGCDNSECGFWIHADCDGISSDRLKAMEAEDAEYSCPRCRANQETAKVSLPAALAVECDGNEGDYLPAEHMIRCRCEVCLGRKKVDPSAFERHSKCQEANWRESIRVSRIKTSLSGWLDMMEGFKAEGLAYTAKRTQAAKAHDALASVQKRLDVPYTPIHVKWSGERCGVCHSEEDFEDDELITCDRCHVTVHELCYGVRRSAAAEKHSGQHGTGTQSPGNAHPDSRIGSPGKRPKVWVCRACEDPLLKPHCCLCPVRGGALKPTSIEGRWAHVACAQWVTETQLADPAGAMEPVEGIERIPKARWDLVCKICKQQCGAPIQCQQARCVRAYHVMCARLDGLFMEMVARKDGMETRSYCRVHKAVKAENACVSSSLDAELLKRGVVPSRAKPRAAKRTPVVGETRKEVTPSGGGSAARCRPYVPKSERPQVFVRRRPIPQLYEGVVRHARPQLEFLQQQCAVHTRAGDDWVARRQSAAPEGLSVSGMIEHMQATEKSRLSFGKSGIHGWGLIARKTILEGDYVVDYRGTLVRPSVANLREKYYRRIGKDCYLFKVDDQHVVDATETGNLGRLINHSCGPNCYSQITRVDGITRIILRAKRDVQAGEELTYDYRFAQEEDKDRVPCHCGAANCRKFMN
ncbi:histone-lysine N-methyltransferase [Klebsormidium nitens]|uniref:Histone-lysine N-methyltransferase n=1 Tax=Klebsormidium nitens TaxID=105231 RepID=A0A1Y1I9U4_KLENI|nr:histone-lysine N-methyltransferase [Klebsormidium nitens]|eukprot:GAQ87333.1 histone-lysine N-methyltransferase [Klebsormidium nitens]